MSIYAIPLAAPAAMNAIAHTPALASPCNQVCTIEPRSGLCIGCGRALSEIAAWIEYSDNERSRIMAELPRRLASLHDANSNERT